MSRTVLIVGVAGFLGRYAAREFARAGWRVGWVDEVPPENAPPEIVYHRLHLPAPAFEELLATDPPEACIHAAGRASVSLSMTDPAADFQDGVVLTFSLLDALRRHAPACRFVLISSAAVYGNPPSLPVSETHPIAPLSPYGYHKRQCELLVEEFARLYAQPALAVRIFSAYGPGLRRQVAWDICARAIGTGRLLLRGSGNESRDFIHAADVARALVLLVERAPAEGEIYNLAMGREMTIRDLAKTLLAHLDLTMTPEFDGHSPPGDPRNWRADISRIAALGFHPTIPLDDGLRAAAIWTLAELRGSSPP